MTVRSDFSDTFADQFFGRITGTFLVSQFPDVPAQLARIKAYGGNLGSINIGSFRNTGMFPLPWPLAAGDDTGWFAVPLNDTEPDGVGNLNSLYLGQSSGSCYLAYWVQK